MQTTALPAQLASPSPLHHPPPLTPGQAALCKPLSTAVFATAAASPTAGPGKDSRWLTLEVCREFARNKCPRNENECRYAHPPSEVEVQTGRVVCCFDSIKGRCHRINPPCKYLHPPQHLKEQLLQNGRNNLIRRNLQVNGTCFFPASTTMLPMFPPYLIDNASATYYSTTSVLGMLSSLPLNFQMNCNINNNNNNNNNTCIDSLNNNNSLPALPEPPSSAQHSDSTSEHSERACPSPSSGGSVGGAQVSLAPLVPNQAAYYHVVDPTGRDALATYYSPVIIQNVGSAGGYVPVMKPAVTSVNDVKGVLYPCGVQYSSPYQQLGTLNSLCQPPPCYQIPGNVITSSQMNAIQRS